MYSQYFFAKQRYDALGYTKRQLDYNDLLVVCKGEEIKITQTNYTAPEVYFAHSTKPQIFISEKWGRNQKWFFLGHALGHHFLHGGFWNRTLKLKNDLTSGSEKAKALIAIRDQEANVFAVSTFLPNSVLENIVINNEGNRQKIEDALEEFTKKTLGISSPLNREAKLNLFRRLLAYIHYLQVKKRTGEKLRSKQKQALSAVENWCSNASCM